MRFSKAMQDADEHIDGNHKHGDKFEAMPFVYQLCSMQGRVVNKLSRHRY